MKRFLSIILVFAFFGAGFGAEKKDEGQEYHMPSDEFSKKFGIARDVIPRAPQATFAPIPPFPFKMREKQLNGSSTYVVRIDAKGTVKAVDLVGYSRKEFSNGRDSLLKWRFGGIAKDNLYLVTLRYTLRPAGAMVEQVL